LKNPKGDKKIMDKLLKHAVDDNVVGFSKRFKAKMQDHFDAAKTDITKAVAADMAGTEPMEEEDDDLNESDPMHVFVYASGKGIKWRTSTGRTGGEPSGDVKDEKALRAYFQKVFGKKKEFTLEIRESITESIASAIKDADLGPDNTKRDGKLITLTWKKVQGIQAKELADRLKKELKPYADKIKFIGAEKKGAGVEAEIELK